MPASTLSGRSVALLRVRLDDCTPSEGQLISHGNCARSEKLLLKAGAKTEAGQSNGGWIEAVVENASEPRAPVGALRIYFAGSAYCQISSTGEAALAAELLGRLGA